MAESGKLEKDLTLVEEFATVRALTAEGKSVQVPKSKFGGNLEIASETVLGGFKAAVKTEEYTEEVKIDPTTGKAYVKPSSEVTVATAYKVGGIIAAAKTESETVEVKIDNETGKLYVPEGDGTPPDNEDIHIATVEGVEVLQFNDKAYSVSSYSGLGRVYLRKKMVDGVNVLTQSMIPTANTNVRYIIQYDYDLQGATITIPEGCELVFEGGSFSNGTLSISKNRIVAPLTEVIFNKVNLIGIYNEKFSSAWCGCLPNDTSIDCTEKLSYVMGLLDTSSTSQKSITIQFYAGRYYFSEWHILEANLTIKGFGEGFTERTHFCPMTDGQNYIIKAGGGKYDYNTSPYIYRLSILNVIFDADAKIFENRGDGNYLGGLLVLDRVQIGHFDLRFYNGGLRGSELVQATVPPLFIGAYTYEVIFDNIICYLNYGKSDLPVVLFGSTIWASNGNSAMLIRNLMAETSDGPVISQPNGFITELEIDNVFYEGVAEFGHEFCEKINGDGGYYLKDRDSLIDDFKGTKKVPLFYFNYANVHIKSLVCNSVARTKWINTLDEDDIYKTTEILQLGSIATNSHVVIDNILHDACPFLGFSALATYTASTSTITVKSMFGTPHNSLAEDGTGYAYLHPYVFKNEPYSTGAITINDKNCISNELPFIRLGDVVTAEDGRMFPLGGGAGSNARCNKYKYFGVSNYQALTANNVVQDTIIRFQSDNDRVLNAFKVTDEDCQLKIKAHFVGDLDVYLNDYGAALTNTPTVTTFSYSNTETKFINIVMPVQSNRIYTIGKSTGVILYIDEITLERTESFYAKKTVCLNKSAFSYSENWYRFMKVNTYTSSSSSFLIHFNNGFYKYWNTSQTLLVSIDGSGLLNVKVLSSKTAGTISITKLRLVKDSDNAYYLEFYKLAGTDRLSIRVDGLYSGLYGMSVLFDAPVLSSGVVSVVKEMNIVIPTFGLQSDAPSDIDAGTAYFATDLGENGKPIWWNGTAWVDATGVEV